MKKAAVLFIFSLILPAVSLSTTSNDLRSRIQVDGRVVDYEKDEWVLDGNTDVPERAEDSRWGSDNDIHGIILTWDLYNIYIAVPCVAFNSTIMLFLDTECGGVKDLEEAGYFRRNIRFSEFTPNFLVATTTVPQSVTAAYLDCSRELVLLDEDCLEAWFLQDGLQGGSLELAIPWEELGRFVRSGTVVTTPERGTVLSLLAVVTGHAGTGAGDAAPNPSSLLENDPARVAVCDNTIRIPLDADEDGMLDLDVSPREVVTFSLQENESVRQPLPLGLELAQKIIAPETGETLAFRPVLELDSYSLPVFLTARIFSSSGQLIDVIYEESSRRFSGFDPISWDEWDGRDARGNLVPGGVYILTISGGTAKGVATQVVKGTFAVIR
jgi:hypothetical protein